MMVYDDLVESLIKRRQLFYVIKIELQKPTSVGGMWMYTPHTFQIQQTAIIRLPPFAVNTCIFGIFSHLHVKYVLDILISPPQHTPMGKEILEV